jgi:hypothetical protein
MQQLPSGFTADAPLPRERRDRIMPAEDRDRGRDPWNDPYVAPPITRRRDPVGWGPMRVGLSMMIWGMITLLVAPVCLVLAALLGVGARGGAAPFLVLGALGAIGVVVAVLLLLVGLCLCCTIPAASGSRGWAVGLLVTLVLTALLLVAYIALLGRAFALRLDEEAALPALLLIVLVRLAVSFAGSLCLTMVLRAAARYWGDARLGAGFVTYFIVSWVAPVALLVIGCGLGVMAAAGGKGLEGLHAFSAVLGCGLLIFALILFFWLISLLSRLRNLIPTGGSTRRYEVY